MLTEGHDVLAHHAPEDLGYVGYEHKSDGEDEAVAHLESSLGIHNKLSVADEIIWRYKQKGLVESFHNMTWSSFWSKVAIVHHVQQVDCYKTYDLNAGTEPEDDRR